MKVRFSSGDEDNRNLHTMLAKHGRRLGTCAPICYNN